MLDCMNDHEQLLEFLSGQTYMTIAVTMNDGTPWAIPVRIKAWEGEAFEWDSHTKTEHSKAIALRPNIAISIYTPDTSDTIQFGFYAQASAKRVSEPSEHGIARYRAVVSKCFINDASFKKREVTL